MSTLNSASLLQLAYSLAVADSSRGLLPYLRHVVVDSRPEPARLTSVGFPWQWEFADWHAPAVEYATGHRDSYSGPRCFWHGLARGHDKTSMLARLANWALCFGKRPIVAVAAAADRDQAALLTQAMLREAQLNPWLGERLTFQRDRVIGPTGELHVLTSDAPTAAGLRADLIICDEISHWESRDLWDMLFSGLHKRPQAMCVVITNAGVRPSWQWDIKEAAKTSALWRVYEAEGRLQTWMSEADVEEARKLLLPSEARRLLDNRWIDAAEESGFLSRVDVEACEALGIELGLTYQTKGRPGPDYWAGIDYGPKRDRTTLSVVHQSSAGLVLIDKLDVWQGRPDDPVKIADVRSWLHEARQQFPNLSAVADPYQLEELVQDLSRHMRIERYEARGGKANYEMAECLRSLIVNRSIAWYPRCGQLDTPSGSECLKDELCRLVLKRMVYGYRFDHEAGCHDDRAVAIGMPCVMLLNRPRSTTFHKPPPLENGCDFTPFAPRASAEERGLYGMGKKI